ncbi:MAG: hypothetical protein ACE5ID_02955 [Acidobacteriota bacterium]
MTPRPSKLLFLFLAACLASGDLFAGGPALARTGGGPVVYPNGGRQIPYNPDQGGLGPFTAAEALALVRQAFDQWENIPTASATFVDAGLLAQDVDGGNFQSLLFSTAPDGLNPVIFDDDGAIFTSLFGSGSAVLGVAFPEWFSRDAGIILESLALFNGQFETLGFPPSEMLSIMVHELGHFSGLTHSVVNNQIARLADETGPTPFDTFPPISLMGLIETMSPRAFINGGQATPHRDDQAAFSFLYPAPGFFADSGALQGTILGPDGQTPLNGVNVIARNIAAPFTDAVSAISGNLAGTGAASDPLAGFFRIDGLTPGATYAVYADEIEDSGFAVPALSPLPGPEEFYNGPQESADPGTDDPSQFVPLVPVAGTPLTGIDITLNRLAPGPIKLTRNSTQQLFLPFPFSFCGQSFGSLFVSSNGNITFGIEDPDRTPTPEEFLGGPPRIAPLWTNLNPTRKGEVSFSQTRRSFTITFTDVPEVGLGGRNSFRLRLTPSPSRFQITYGRLDVTDGLAGYSCGGFVTSGLEQPVDLSRHLGPRGLSAHGQAAFYELFDQGGNDLDGLSMTFDSPNGFPDRTEPNGSFRRSPPLRLPLDTTSLFTRIDPLGDDIDFFHFRAPAGAFLIAETAASNPLLDTVLGLFNATTGQILAADDDLDQAFGLTFRLGEHLPGHPLHGSRAGIRPVPPQAAHHARRSARPEGR